MKGTVLIVDDDQNLLDSLSRSLRREPFEVLTSSSPQAALEVLAAKPVDVVISDQEMPGMTGTAFLKQVRARCPDTIRFVLTGKATLDSTIDAINEGGISRFFLKPCNPADLSISIRQGLQQRELTIAAHRLLQKNKRQRDMISRLERQYPDITKVERDEDGAIRVEDFHGSFDELLAEINGHLRED